MSKKTIRRPQQYKRPKDRTLREWWQDQKESTRKSIIYGCVAVLAVIVLLLVYYYAIYDDGSLRVKDNALVGAEANWLVGARDGGKNSEYYHLADVSAPEGYAASENTLTSSGLQQTFTFTGNGFTLNVNPVSRPVADMADTVHATITAYVGENGEVSPVTDLDSKLGACKYFLYTNVIQGEEKETYGKSLVLYAPARYSDCSILVSLSQTAETKDALSADDVLLAEAVKALDAITPVKE